MIRSLRSSPLAFLVPAGLVWLGWLVLMAGGDRWGLFGSSGAAGIPHWYMTVTMAFGSFIAGATSEGGGAVAFPVMTLLFGVEPPVARDFSLMIQTVGMNAAAFTIFFLRVPIERRALVWASLGGAAGVILGLERIRLDPGYAKMLFVSTWLAFAFALYWINRYRAREVHAYITYFLPRHAVLLFGTGVIGGLVSAVTGSGLDITTFSLLVLRLRISEKIATPTSVVLMALNATVGFAYKAFFIPGGMESDAWSYWYVCVPIVVLGAPFGAAFIRDKSRLFVAAILYVSIGLQFLWALVVIPFDLRLAAFSVAVFVAGVALFRLMVRGGTRRLEWLAETGRVSEDVRA